MVFFDELLDLYLKCQMPDYSFQGKAIPVMYVYMEMQYCVR